MKTDRDASLTTPWSKSIEEIVRGLDVSPEAGLGSREASSRRKRFGPNRLKEARKKSVWRILFNQFESLIILILAVAAAISFLVGEWVDGLAITAAIFINTAFGFVTELRTVRSMEALRELGGSKAKARREGSVREVRAEELVPGDIVVLEGGDLVPADIRLVEASKLEADESALTGESTPVPKTTDPAEEDTPLAERSCMVFKGASITRGSGEGVVVATGMDTEIGKVVTLAEEAEQEITPLEKRLNRLGRKLIHVILTAVALISAIGLVAGQPLLLLFEVSIALAVAAIPEGLPIVATIALARGMWRMARRNALVNRLSAVEALGATNVIFVDKTGTLTENRMTLTKVILDSGIHELDEDGGLAAGDAEAGSDRPHGEKLLREALKIGVLCNNASYEKGSRQKEAAEVGDPVEVALLEAGAKVGLRRDELLEGLPEEREEPFDSELMMMATFHSGQGLNGSLRVAVKGAPEAVIEACSRVRTSNGEVALDRDGRKKWMDLNGRLAEDGFRIIALAAGTADAVDVDPYSDLTLLGLAGLWDPPRKNIEKAVASCKEAGIRVIMVTGDHAATARSIGVKVRLADGESVEVVEGGDLGELSKLSEEQRQHLLTVPIFARMSPEQKLDLIKLHQESGSIVAMTGDGVNDAPALKKADIGVAMGKRGTQVAKEAADIILKDDAFSTIVMAVAMGRNIFENIRKFVLYLLSGNLSEILIVILALMVSAPLPILALQILYLNMLSDVFPALALGFGKDTPEVMQRKPRDPEESVMTKSHWRAVIGYSIVIAAAVLSAFALAINWLSMEAGQAVTVSFLTLSFARLWHVFNMRRVGSSFTANNVVRNPYVWAAITLCVILLLLAVYVPGLASILKLTPPGGEGWGLILASSLAPLIVGQLHKGIASRSYGNEAFNP